MLFVQLSVHASVSITLSWTPSAATNVAGYKIYAGTASHHYTATNVVGLATSGTIAALVPGITYYFAATTYDSAGHQSAFSTETSYTYTVPGMAAALTRPVRASKQFSFLVSGIIGFNYVVQASTNLSNWVTLSTNIAPYTFVDTNAATFSHRYYRTYYLSL